MKLHPKGWSSEDYSVKTVIESLSFQSLSVRKHKTISQNRVFTDLPGKEKKQKKIIPHTLSWPRFPLSSIYWLGLHALLIHSKDTWIKMTGWNIKNDINHLLLLSSSKGLVFFFFSLHRLWCLCTLWCHAHLAVMPTQTQLNGQGQEQIAFRIYKALLEVSTMYSRHRGRSLLQVEDAWASSWPYGWAQKMTFLQQQQGQRPGGQEGLVCVRNHTAFLAAGRHCTREKADQHRTSFQGV